MTMSRERLLWCALVFAICLAPAPEPRWPGDLDIRTEQGEILVSAREIRTYDGSTHVMTCAPWVKGHLEHHVWNRRYFVVCVRGQPIYRGAFVHPAESTSPDAAVICRLWGGGDVIRLDLRDSSRQPFPRPDPRGDERIRAALKGAGKWQVTR